MTHPTENDCDTRSCPLDRRTVLIVAGLAATAAAVAGCDSDRSGAEAAAKPDTPTESAPTGPPGNDLPTGVLSPVARVPVGGGVVVEDGKVLVVQPSGGVFKAYDARCPHKGVAVNAPDADGIVVCPRHNARFKAGDGSVIKGPAERALSGIPVKVDGEYVVRA